MGGYLCPDAHIKGMKTTIVLLLFLSACSSMDDDYRRIDTGLRPFLKEFIKEAELRGVQIDTSNLKLTFSGHISGGAQGRTWYDTHSIMIDSTSSDWGDASTTLVFHELGHLYLRREHDNGEINGHLKSIMNGPYSPIFEGEKAYRRKYYVDELFNPSAAPADWML